MNINITRAKIVITIPVENVEEVRNAICKAGTGIIGNYTDCSMSTKCIGTFKPTDEANHYIGKNNNLEFVEEVTLEVVCDVKLVKKLTTRLREIHPYEKPAIDIISLLEIFLNSKKKNYLFIQKYSSFSYYYTSLLRLIS